MITRRQSIRPRLYLGFLPFLLASFLTWHPSARAQFVSIPVPGGAVLKMAADLQRPCIYALQAPAKAGQLGNLLFINTTNNSIEKTLPIGTKPMDLAIHYGDNRLYVASWGENATYVVDLNAKSLLPSLNLGANIYNINAGKPGRIITEAGSQWVAVNIVDTATGNVVESMPFSQYAGDGEMDPNGLVYYHADDGISNAHIHKTKVENDVAVEIAASIEHPYGSRNLVLSPDGGRLFWRGYIFDANLNEIGSLGEEIHAATLHADLALGVQHAFDKHTGQVVYTWPFSSDVLAVSGDQQNVFLFNSASNQLVVVPMATIAPMPNPVQNPQPADGAIPIFPMAQVSWAPTPAAVGYQVYLGTNRDAVASADIHSTLCLGTTFDNFLTLPTLTCTNAGTVCYWRVDAMGVFGATRGTVWSFTVSSLAVWPQTLAAGGVVKYPVSPLSISITGESQTPWSLEIQQPWLSTPSTNGSTPALVTLNIDATKLSSGFHTNTITLMGGGSVMQIPVVLQLVEPTATRMVTDPNRDYIYVLYPGSGHAADAFLLFINTESGIPEKVIPIGINPTDMSINRFDDRLYVSNCGYNQTRVVDLKTQTELAPLLLGTNVFRINAGLPGRLVIEGFGESEGGVAPMSLIDTATGTVIVSGTPGQGDGQFDPSGRYYYRENQNPIWSNSLNKYDLGNDAFDFLTFVNGSDAPSPRNIVTSLDGSALFWKGGGYDTNLKKFVAYGCQIWSCSTNGAIAFSDLNGYDTATKRELFTLNIPTSISAVDRRNQKFWHYNWFNGLIESDPLSAMMPPKIITQPQDQTTNSGSDYVMSVKATGLSPISSFWFFNGSNCAVTTNFQFALPHCQASNAGDYHVVVSNAFGIVRSSNFVLKVEDVAPRILTQPASTNRPGQTNVTFFVETAGSLPMSYQWRFNGTNLAAATNNVLTLDDLGDANEGDYSVVVSNLFGVVTSTNAWLDVLDRTDALNCTNMVWDFGTSQSWFTEFTTTHDGVAALQSGPILPSAQTKMQATVVGPGKLNFWWMNNAGVSSDSLRFSINNVEQSRISGSIYWQNLTFDIGSGTNVLEWTFAKAPPYLGAAAGYVDQVTFTPGGSPPTITKAPASQLALVGAITYFSGEASGTPPLRYQWQFNGSNMDWATNSTLPFVNVHQSDEGLYSLVVSNDFGSASTPDVLLDVVGFAEALNATDLNWNSSDAWPWNPESTTTHDGVAALQSARIFAGQQSKFQAIVNGPGTLTFWWMANSISSSDYLAVSINGQENARLTGMTGWNVQTIYLGYGTNVVEWCYTRKDPYVNYDAAGWVDQVSFAPGVTPPFVTLAPVSQVLVIGSNGDFKATASGTPPLSFQWQFNGANLDGATNTTLVLTNVQFANEGSYRLAISNATGFTNTSAAVLTVVDFTRAANATNLIWSSAGAQPWSPQTVTTHDGVAALQSGVIAAGRESMVFTIVNGPGELSFWWLVSAVLNSNYAHFDIDGVEQDRISGATSWAQKTYYVTPGSHILSWTYSKTVENNGASDCAWLDQVSFVPGGTAPFITLNPTNQAARLSSDVTFTVGALGTPPLTYQWLRNDVEMANETNASLTIRNFQSPNIGTYAVRIANDYGSVLSAAAQLNQMNVFAWGAGTNRTGVSSGYGQSIVPTNLYATAIAAGGFHSLALQPDGRVKAWGDASYGALNVPTTLTNAMAISAGMRHSLALRSNGTVTAWGYSIYNATLVPTNATNVAAIAAGGNHSMALLSNGTVVAWGAGTSPSSSLYFGQSMVPTNLTEVTAIAAGGYHSLALKKNGTVVAWGLNTSGQTNVPVGLSNVVAIAAGESNSVALTASGTLAVWGGNSYGQTNVPPGLSNVVAISCGAAHIMALQKNGALMVWGRNLEGQTNLPLAVTNVTAIAAGGYHCIAMVNFGSVTFPGQFRGQAVFVGDEATFSPAVLGQTPMTFQWLRNGTNVVNATNASLTIENAQRADEGLYQLVVSNVYGIKASGTAALKVMDLPPSIEGQPLDISVLPNASATFEASVVGWLPLDYQWQFNGVNIPWATNSTLTVANAQFGNEGSYSLVASNQYGVVISSNAVLNVIDLAEALGNAGLVWTSSGQMPWFVQSTNTHDGIFATAAGPLSYSSPSILQTSVTGPGTISFWWADSRFMTIAFMIDGVTQTQWSRYYGTDWSSAVFYVGAGVHSLTWKAINNISPGTYNAGMAYLDQVTFTPGAVIPFISTQPQSQTLPAGSKATFNVVASGTPPMTYQWYSNLVSIPGATNATYTMTNVQTNHAASYSVVVSNNYGFVTSTNATLVVTPSAPSIVAQTGNLQVMVGGQAAFSVDAAGSNPLDYQWMFNGAPIAGETNRTLVRTNIQASDVGIYYLVVSNALGGVNSTNALLRIYTIVDLANAVAETGIAWSTTDVPWFPQSTTTHDGISAAQSGVIADKQQSTLQGAVSGPATVTFWWKVNCDSFWDSLAFDVNGTVQNSMTGTVDWQQASHYIGAGTNILTWKLYPVHQAYAGGTGWLDQVQIIPGGTAAIINSSSGNIVTNAGNDVTLSVAATGTPPLFYQWLLGGTNLPGATNAALLLKNVQGINAGIYSVVVTNDFGLATNSNLTLTVNGAAPVVTKQPADQAGVIQGDATFTVAVKGSSPFQYQWRFNDVNILGATNSSLVISSLQFTNAGSYSVRIDNDQGSTFSSNAVLEVGMSAVREYWSSLASSYATPIGLTNLVSLAVGAVHTVGLRDDGTVTSWGNNSYGQTNVPAGLSNVIAISAGLYHTVALKSDGTVVAWGDSAYGQTSVPNGLSNVTAITASAYDTFALKSDGTVIGWGDNASNQLNIPAGLSNVVSISAGPCNGFAVKEDGSVVQWGNGPTWKENGIPAQLQVPAGITNIASIAASITTARLLLNDGTVRSFGIFDDEAPGKIAAMAMGCYSSMYMPEDYTLFLRYNGMILKEGYSFYTPQIPNNISNVVAISASYQHAAVIINNGAPGAAGKPVNQVAQSGATVMMGSGLVGAFPLAYQWQFNGVNLEGATNVTLVLPGVSLDSAGNYRCIASNAFGSATNTAATLAVLRSASVFKEPSYFSEIGFAMQLGRLTGHGNIVIMASTNLVDWVPVLTNAPVAGSLQYLDFEATNHTRRFYRAVEQ